MKRIAIIGGGIAGLSAAYELGRQQRAGASIEFTLFEAALRLGGIVETERHGEFIIECGPDSWVTEKPWARDLAVELGLESDLIFSRDGHRKTYLAEGDTLRALPDGMSMMVPVELASVLDSPLFSEQAKLEYLREPQRAEDLKRTALDGARTSRDESVRDFVVRHFGTEVANTIAAPLLAGVLGGDIAALSARALLPAFVAMEREHGSLILGLQRRKQIGTANDPIFTSLGTGLASLTEAMEQILPPQSICRGCLVPALERIDARWRIHGSFQERGISPDFDAVAIATPACVTASLLTPFDPRIKDLLPQQSSSAIVVAFAFSAEQSESLRVPRGFGFLVPQRNEAHAPAPTGVRDPLEAIARRALLACTFVDQKFPQRVPQGAVLIRAFFGGPAAPALLQESDVTLTSLGHRALESILGKLPEPAISVVRRWPDSMPLYPVGHLERIRELEIRVAELQHIRLIGNAYRGVGLPDLIREGRYAAREMVAALAQV